MGVRERDRGRLLVSEEEFDAAGKLYFILSFNYT